MIGWNGGRGFVKREAIREIKDMVKLVACWEEELQIETMEGVSRG